MLVLLQEAIPLAGDGFLYKKNIEVYTPVRFSEILSLSLYRAIYLILPKFIKSGEMAYRIVNTLAGICSAICYIKISQKEEIKVQPIFLILFLGLGINVLFFYIVDTIKKMLIIKCCIAIRNFLRRCFNGR